MLRIEDIAKTFNPGTITEKKALKGITLHLEPGDFVTVIGGNGAGKSTLMNSIAGTFPVDRGKIIIDGQDITKWPEHKRAKYIGRVFQDPMMGTAANMQIEENMAIAARRGKTPTLRWSAPVAQREFFREQLKTLNLGLEDRLESKVGLLSGGQRQALTLLMATLVEPKLLQRNLLYTAVTRAKKLVILIGSKAALNTAVENDRTRKRYTLLAERLGHRL